MNKLSVINTEGEILNLEPMISWFISPSAVQNMKWKGKNAESLDTSLVVARDGKLAQRNQLISPPPPINFVHDLYFSANLLLFILQLFRVRLG